MINKILLLVLIILLLLLSFFIHKAQAEAPVLEIAYPSDVVGNDLKEYAYNQIRLSFGEKYWDEFDQIIKHESRWICTAQNPHSSAYGLGGFLNSTWKTVGHSKTSDCKVQVDGVIDYIEKNYKDPVLAWSFWKKNNWY